jgi:hypothetical protein
LIFFLPKTYKLNGFPIFLTFGPDKDVDDVEQTNGDHYIVVSVIQVTQYCI